MRRSKYFSPTLREVPVDAEAISHKLMLRAGLIRRLSAGIYTLLPLGKRILENVTKIVRDEMDEIGCQEMLMPALLPSEPWEESGRWDLYGGEMFRVKDRKGREFCLGPTHEEIVTLHVRNDIKSYRQLPLMLYQIQTKYRDERRPRYGVIRAREFLMKDMYSFDVDEETHEKSYKIAYDSYCNIFEKCGVTYIPVEADTGAIGGSASHEFVVEAENGECRFTHCKECGYSANIEIARFGKRADINKEVDEELKLIDTPNEKTIDQVVKFLDKNPNKLIKAIIYKVDEKFVMALVRGDDEISETKLKKILGATAIEIASEEETVKVTNTPLGFAGPIGFDGFIVADDELIDSAGMICGGLAKDKHYIGVTHGRDWKQKVYADIREIKNGDTCPNCGKVMEISTGLEVGQTFTLGTKYSSVMNCNFLDQNGKSKPMIMGCYGIGVSRTVAGIIEQNHDDKGIIWPVRIAPFKVVIIPTNIKDESIVNAAEKFYEDLKTAGIETMIDDRKDRPGVKFNDAELIGFPLRIVIGKKLAENLVEVTIRRSCETKLMEPEKVLPFVQEFIEESLKANR